MGISGSLPHLDHCRPQARTAGVMTIEHLAQLSDSVTIPKIHAPALDRLRSQARLQMVKRTTDENVVEVLPILERRGLFRLPEPAEGDLFFDMEGDPVYSPQGSLEYLFGFHYLEDGEDTYTAFWARDKAGERKAFEDALDFITMRLAQYPQAFVYHYAAYEQTALKRLASEYGGRAGIGMRSRSSRSRMVRVRTKSTTCCATGSSSTSTRWFARRFNLGARVFPQEPGSVFSPKANARRSSQAATALSHSRSGSSQATMSCCTRSRITTSSIA